MSLTKVVIGIWKHTLCRAVLVLTCFVLLIVTYFFNLVPRSTTLFIAEPIAQHNSTDGQWYNLSSDIFRLYAYSSFYDDRPSLLSSPVVRVIAISDPVENLKNHHNVSMRCVLHYESRSVTMAMQHDPMGVGFGWPLNGKGAKEYVLTCPTLNGAIPNSVSILTSNNNNVAVSVPVTRPNKPKKSRDFCVCVQVAYGNLNPYKLIEWLELQKLLGVSLVGIYNLSISGDALKVLDHYADERFVDFRKTEEIYKNDDRHYLLQGSPVINDCIYRHMYEFNRILVIDMDEFIMPRQHSNLADLIKHLDLTREKSPAVNYVFRNNYFFFDLGPDESIPEYLSFLRFRKKVAVSDEGYSVKSIINPQACTHMHNHYCWGVTANYSEFESSRSVNPKVALNQHYKKCHLSKEECDSLMKVVRKDDVMLKLKDSLSKMVKDKIKVILGDDV